LNKSKSSNHNGNTSVGGFLNQSKRQSLEGIPNGNNGTNDNGG